MEKELNKAYTFGKNKGVKAYYNEQLCTVELPEAVFEYILSLVPTEEQPQAEWIVYNYPAHECTYCSNCKAEYDQIELYLGGTEYPSYCPSCGAKMTW